jgi:hypothetical protein
MTLTEKLSTTNPSTYSAVLAVAAAYERLWSEVQAHPGDRLFVSDMLSYLHAASVLPQMRKL